MQDISKSGRAADSRGVDWADLRRRLEDSRAAVERRLNPSAEEKQKILRARARLLAENQEEPKIAQSRLEIVEFVLASEHYGVEIGYIREIHALQELTPLPCTPPFVLGIANIRGQILSILDIKKLFGLPEKGLTDLNKVICVAANRIEVGILADAILGVRSIAIDELQTSLPTLSGIHAEYIKGVRRDSLAVLDVGKILSDPGIIVDKSRTQTSE
jgi:purine-binding chemotaxis protein CheW